MKIIDVNIALYAADRLSEFHVPVAAWWNAALSGEETIGLPWMTLSGFLRISTNPRLFAKPLSVAEATERVDAWLAQPNVRVVQETDQHWRLFREFVQELGTGGSRTTDAHLAALAVSRGATLVSCDLGFKRFRQLKWENPAA